MVKCLVAVAWADGQVDTPEVGLIDKPDGKPLAEYAHESPVGRPLSCTCRETTSPTALVCVPGLVSESVETFQVKLWLALALVPSAAVTDAE